MGATLRMPNEVDIFLEQMQNILMGMFISHAGAKKKNKVKPLTWLCDWRIFELQFVAALLLFSDAEMYVGLEWWFSVCDNVSVQVNCFNPWSARSGPLWSYVGQEFIHLHYNVLKGGKFFKETVVLHWWESITGNLVLTSQLKI